MANIVTIDGIPVYQALVDAEDTGMFRISLVDDPAVQSDFLAFKSQEAERTVQTYAVQDDEKHLVLGVVMRSDFPIYRRDPDGFEYYIIYKADTIRTMAEKYLAENRQNLVNLMHQDGSDVDGVQMVQYFIKGKGLEPEGFDAIAAGSLFAEFHVENEEVWQAIKAGTYKGFSLEGVFDLAPEQDADRVQHIVDTLEGKFKTILKNSNMAKLKGLLARLAKAIVALGNITTDKGILSWDGEEDLKAGDSVFVEDADGNRTPAADGEYITSDNKTIVVVDGKVSEIRDPEAEVAPTEEEEAQTVKALETDKGKLEWDNESEDLKEGDAVYITDEEGNRNSAPDGEYTTEDGKVISVVDGKVASITDPKAEVSEEGKAQKPGLFRRIAQLFSESYDEKFRKIHNAIASLGHEDFWVVDAGDDFAVIEEWNGDGTSHFLRFAISWDGEGNAIAADPVEVVPAFVTPEERDAADAAFQQLKADYAKIEAELEKVKATPAAKPAHQEFSEQGEAKKTGNKGLDRLATLMSAK